MCEIKTFVSIFMMMMLVVSHADDSPLPSSSPHISISEIICFGKCGVQCSNLLGEIQSFVACFAACGYTCLDVTSKSAYDCATSCAISNTINDNIDARGVNLIVNSCLEDCKNK
ncbi:Thionin related (TAP1) [Medicago truncatula]|uniref:Thionin related (TAP1) n=1 Tax=Medicago truncatula TaxID=3880 RepID=A0A072VHG1_MEDTR|nr:Thionin related (TAP1) [Medicago truncatula]KEH37596.1 Thionin related (TAP1) [Medicago truncatula]